DWWLDALAGPGGWDVVLAEKGGQIVGAMPFTARSWFGFKWLTTPPLTHGLGPWIRPSRAKAANFRGYEKDVMEALIDELPGFDPFVQDWHHSRRNWLPFYWKGFSQTARYTYLLPDI